MGKRGWGLRGIVPILNTPFHEDSSIDYESLARAVEQVVRDGCVGLIVPAVASEVGKLSLDERREMVAFVAEMVGGRIAVIAGVSSPEIETAQLLAAHALGHGVDTVLAQVPSALCDDEPGISAYFEALAEVGASLMIQDLSWGGRGLRVPFIAELYERIDGFVSLKVETVPASVKYSAARAATHGDLHIACGWGLGQMVDALLRGVDAFTTTAVNYPFVQVHRLYDAGRLEEARALFDRFAPFLLWCQQHIDVSIGFLKEYCRAVGLFRTAVIREPRGDYDEMHKAYGRLVLDDLLQLEGRLRAHPALPG